MKAIGAFLGALAAMWCVAVEAAPEGTGLPLPRFVSLRADEVNMRTGPGIQYPIEWVYHRSMMPVEVIAEYHTWRKVRDWQGAQGWVHKSTLSGRRTFVVTGQRRTVRANPAAESAAVVQLDAGVIGNLLECPEGSGWCRVEADGYVGWLRHVDFWGVHRDDVLAK